jgi:hypothetical protein
MEWTLDTNDMLNYAIINNRVLSQNEFPNWCKEIEPNFEKLIINFGKFRGKIVSELPENYLSWLLEIGTIDFNDNIKFIQV